MTYALKVSTRENQSCFKGQEGCEKCILLNAGSKEKSSEVGLSALDFLIGIFTS